MKNLTLANLSDKILADLVRVSFKWSLPSQQRGSRALAAGNGKEVLPVANDIPSYLRSVYRWVGTSEVRGSGSGLSLPPHYYNTPQAGEFLTGAIWGFFSWR